MDYIYTGYSSVRFFLDWKSNPTHIHCKNVIYNPNPLFKVNWQSNPNPITILLFLEMIIRAVNIKQPNFMKKQGISKRHLFINLQLYHKLIIWKF
jgi:hypothetical protein